MGRGELVLEWEGLGFVAEAGGNGLEEARRQTKGSRGFSEQGHQAKAQRNQSPPVDKSRIPLGVVANPQDSRFSATTSLLPVQSRDRTFTSALGSVRNIGGGTWLASLPLCLVGLGGGQSSPRVPEFSRCFNYASESHIHPPE